MGLFSQLKKNSKHKIREYVRISGLNALNRTTIFFIYDCSWEKGPYLTWDKNRNFDII